MSETTALAYSPCPNDTYIFAAWTRGLIAGAPPVEVVLDDVEALNIAARAGRFKLTKVSYGAIPYLTEKYRILRAGGALGRGCGPLIVTRAGGAGATQLSDFSENAVFAIPGDMTTAFLLLQLALGRTPRTRVMRFDTIVDAVADGSVDAGLIIHESRFTYREAGLHCASDLGEWWEMQTGRPIPLGAILVRRDVSANDAALYNYIVRESLQFARTDYPRISEYVRAHAFEMREDVMQAHIGLYVNAYSDDVGADGEAAIRELFSRAAAARLIPVTEPEFAE